jgi:hypothetical protein
MRMTSISVQKAIELSSLKKTTYVEVPEKKNTKAQKVNKEKKKDLPKGTIICRCISL